MSTKRRYYIEIVEAFATKNDSLYHVLAYTHHNAIGSYEAWKEWRSSVTRNRTTLQQRMINDFDDLQLYWIVAILLAPRLEDVAKWWIDEGDVASYVLEAQIPIETFSAAMCDFLARLLVLNLEIVREAPLFYRGFEEKYLEIAVRLLSLGYDGEAMVALLPVLSPYEQSQLFTGSSISLKLRRVMVRSGRELQ